MLLFIAFYKQRARRVETNCRRKCSTLREGHILAASQSWVLVGLVCLRRRGCVRYIHAYKGVYIIYLFSLVLFPLVLYAPLLRSFSAAPHAFSNMIMLVRSRSRAALHFTLHYYIHIIHHKRIGKCVGIAKYKYILDILLYNAI